MKVRTSAFVFITAMMTTLLAGCGSSVVTSTVTPAAGTVPVSVTMTDDPPAGVAVLFFQVSLTDATLTSSTGTTVSLLNNNTPIQVDVTQLQALSAFLSTANIAGGTYKSLSLTFANPQLVIFNQADTSLGSCAVGSVCQLTPALDSGSSPLSFTASPFPITVTSGAPLGLLIDFHLNTVIQPDLSVNLGVSNGVTVSALPPAPTPPQIGSITGTVGPVTASSNQFTLQTPWGRSFTINTTSSTTFNDFPSSACTAASIACVAQGQIVQVQIASVGTNGTLTASSVTYVQAAAAQTVEGTVINILPSPTNLLPAPVTLMLLVHQNPTASSTFPMGGMVEVSVPPTATLSIDANGFTIPAGLTFANNPQMGPLGAFTVGQNVSVTVVPGSVSNNPSITPAHGMGPSVVFTASGVALEPSQMTGLITATDSSTTSFTLGVGGGPFFAPWPMPTAIAAFNVDTTGQTTYTGFNPDSYSGIAKGELVSVNGWLFATSSGTPPVIAAQSVVQRPGLFF